ncbi:MAG: FadR/GntR family transcriptional regulator [Bacillota bacterium]|nr:FadR/GntR family transcriptional regulator [Bacillota bacterium]
MTVSFQKVSRYRLYQDVVSQLVEHIRAGQIQPGERFPSERELERQMGVSRGILREAFRVLEARGIIESRPGGGRFLRQLNGQNLFDLESGFVRLERAVLLDICEARQIIEVRAAQLAAERGKVEEIEHIKRVIDEFFRTQFDQGEQMDRDLDFHVAVARASGNLVIWELVRVLVGILREHRQQMHLPRAEWAAMCRQHYDVYEAIRAREGREAARRMAEHLERLRKVLEET